MEGASLESDSFNDHSSISWGMLEGSVVFSLYRANSHFNQSSRLHARDYQQFFLLALIGANPGASATEVARIIGIDKSDTSSILDQLKNNQFVVRRRSDSDHRRWGLYLTPVGVHELSKVAKQVRENELQYEALYNNEERRALKDLLRRF